MEIEIEIEMKNELLKNENTLLTSIETLSLFNKVTGVGALSDNEGNFIIREVGTMCQKLCDADTDLSRMFQTILNKTIKIENSFYCPTSIASLGDLQSVGRDADFRDSRIFSLGDLQSIGGDAYFIDSQDNAKLLKTIKTFDEEAIKNHRRMAETLKEILSKSPSIIGGVKLSVKQRKALAAGETIQISGITNKSGRKFTSDVRWNTQENKPQYNNIKPMKEPIKKERPEKTPEKKIRLKM
jgi:hypothetical protein